MRVSILLFFVAIPALAGGHWVINGPDGGSVRRLAFDPADPAVAYAAATNGLFRSADGGQHWAAAPALLGTTVLDVAVAKSDPQVVFAASPDGLYKSSDRGASFRLANSSGSFRLALSAQSADVVYSLTTGGPIQSIDGGATFGAHGSGFPSGQVTGLVVDPQDSSVVYAAFPSSAGVYKSTDGGAHWAQANNGLTATQVFVLAIDPTDGRTLYAGGGTSTLYKSSNGAASWTAVPNGQSDWTYSAIEVSPSSPSTLLAATSRGVFRSTDAGASWTRAEGIPSTTASSAAVDPTNPARFLAALAVHVYRTGDGGATAALAESGLRSFQTSWIAADPHDDAVIYATSPAGFARSADHGRTWSLTTSTAPRLIAVDANASSLYATASNSVVRSIDGGATWSAFGSGLPAGVSPQFLTADPQLSGTLYAVVNGDVYKKVGDGAWAGRNAGLPGSLDFVIVDPHVSSTVYAGGPFGVFKSVDGAASWVAANNGLTGLNTLGLAVDPFDSRHVFAWSPTKGFVSADGGASWAPDPGVRGDRWFDPSAAGVVYSNNFDGLRRSADGGKTWSLLADGLPRSHSLFAIGAGGTPYLADFSGGVFVFQFVRQRAVGR